MRKMFIIGIGMGNPQTITVAGQNAIHASQGLVGSERTMDRFAYEGAAAHVAVTAEEILDWVEEQEELNPVAVLMSGDVGFFSGAQKLQELAKERYEVELIPGISSLQYLCAKAALSWGDVKVMSLHGKSANFTGEIQTKGKVFFLTDCHNTPNYICRCLVEAGLEHVLVHIGERLSYPEEEISSGSPAELAKQSFDPLSVVLVENPKPIGEKIVTHGLKDADFIRGEVPMTKSEVRSVALSRLQLQKEEILYDIGGGTGSVSVEMALQATKGRVYTFECNKEARSLIEKNKEVFGVTNLHIVAGVAPEAMEGLPAPDKAFIGGTRGNMKSILERLKKRNPNIRVVINVIALESLTKAMNGLSEGGYELLDLVQLSVARAKESGEYHLMTAENPIFILTAQGRNP